MRTSVGVLVVLVSDVIINFFSTCHVVTSPPREIVSMATGGLHNSQSAIRRGQKGALLVSQTTSRINSNITYQSFWIALRDGRLSVGRGERTNVNTFMTAPYTPLPHSPAKLYVGFAAYDVPISYVYGAGVEPELPAVRSIQFTNATSVKSPAWFVAPGNRALFKKFTASTVDAKRFDFVFYAATASDAYIALLKSDVPQTIPIADCWEIVIGGADNSRSTIRVGNQGANVVETATPHILSVRSLRAFWISMRDRVLAVGRGTQVGERQFMAARVQPLVGDPSELFVSFASWEHDATFAFGVSELEAQSIPLTVPADAAFDAGADDSDSEALPPTSLPPSPAPSTNAPPAALELRDAGATTAFTIVPPKVLFRTTGSHGIVTKFAEYHLSASAFEFMFQTRTRSTAYVSFATIDSVPNARAQSSYEIALGLGDSDDDARSSITYGHRGLLLATSRQLSDSSPGAAFVLQTFWIALHDGVLSVGRGSLIGHHQFLTASVPALSTNPQFLTVGFAGGDSAADFVYGIQPGSTCSVLRPARNLLSSTSHSHCHHRIKKTKQKQNPPYARLCD